MEVDTWGSDAGSGDLSPPPPGSPPGGGIETPPAMNSAHLSTSILRLDKVGLADDDHDDDEDMDDQEDKQQGSSELLRADSPVVVRAAHGVEMRAARHSTNTDPGLVSDEDADFSENIDPGVNSDDDHNGSFYAHRLNADPGVLSDDGVGGYIGSEGDMTPGESSDDDEGNGVFYNPRLEMNPGVMSSDGCGGYVDSDDDMDPGVTSDDEENNGIFYGQRMDSNPLGTLSGDGEDRDGNSLGNGVTMDQSAEDDFSSFRQRQGFVRGGMEPYESSDDEEGHTDEENDTDVKGAGTSFNRANSSEEQEHRDAMENEEPVYEEKQEMTATESLPTRDNESSDSSESEGSSKKEKMDRREVRGEEIQLLKTTKPVSSKDSKSSDSDSSQSGSSSKNEEGKKQNDGEQSEILNKVKNFFSNKSIDSDSSESSNSKKSAEKDVNPDLADSSSLQDENKVISLSRDLERKESIEEASDTSSSSSSSSSSSWKPDSSSSENSYEPNGNLYGLTEAGHEHNRLSDIREIEDVENQSDMQASGNVLAVQEIELEIAEDEQGDTESVLGEMGGGIGDMLGGSQQHESNPTSLFTFDERSKDDGSMFVDSKYKDEDPSTPSALHSHISSDEARHPEASSNTSTKPILEGNQGNSLVQTTKDTGGAVNYEFHLVKRSDGKKYIPGHIRTFNEEETVPPDDIAEEEQGCIESALVERSKINEELSDMLGGSQQDEANPTSLFAFNERSKDDGSMFVDSKYKDEDPSTPSALHSHISSDEARHPEASSNTLTKPIREGNQGNPLVQTTKDTGGAVNYEFHLVKRSDGKKYIPGRIRAFNEEETGPPDDIENEQGGTESALGERSTIGEEVSGILGGSQQDESNPTSLFTFNERSKDDGSMLMDSKYEDKDQSMSSALHLHISSDEAQHPQASFNTSTKPILEGNQGNPLVQTTKDTGGAVNYEFDLIKRSDGKKYIPGHIRTFNEEEAVPPDDIAEDEKGGSESALVKGSKIDEELSGMLGGSQQDESNPTSLFAFNERSKDDGSVLMDSKYKDKHPSTPSALHSHISSDEAQQPQASSNTSTKPILEGNQGNPLVQTTKDTGGAVNYEFHLARRSDGTQYVPGRIRTFSEEEKVPPDDLGEYLDEEAALNAQDIHSMSSWSASFKRGLSLDAKDDTVDSMIDDHIKADVQAVVGQLVQEPGEYEEKDEEEEEEDVEDSDEDSREEWQLSPLIEEEDIASSDGEPWEDEDPLDRKTPSSSFKATSGYLKGAATSRTTSLSVDDYDDDLYEQTDLDAILPEKSDRHRPEEIEREILNMQKDEENLVTADSGLHQVNTEEDLPELEILPHLHSNADLPEVPTEGQRGGWSQDLDDSSSSSEGKKGFVMPLANITKSPRPLAALESFISSTDSPPVYALDIEDLPQFDMNASPEESREVAFDSNSSQNLSSSQEIDGKQRNLSRQDTLDSQDDSLANAFSDGNEANDKDNNGRRSSHSSSSFSSNRTSSDKSSENKDNPGKEHQDPKDDQPGVLSGIWGQLPAVSTLSEDKRKSSGEVESIRSGSTEEVQDEQSLATADDSSMGDKDGIQGPVDTGSDESWSTSSSSSTSTPSNPSSYGSEHGRVTARLKEEPQPNPISETARMPWNREQDHDTWDRYAMRQQAEGSNEEPDHVGAVHSAMRQPVGDDLQEARFSPVHQREPFRYPTDQMSWRDVRELTPPPMDDITPPFGEYPQQRRESGLSIEGRGFTLHEAATRTHESDADRDRLSRHPELTRNEDDRSNTDIDTESEEIASSNRMTEIYENIKNSVISDNTYSTPGRISSITTSSVLGAWEERSPISQREDLTTIKPAQQTLQRHSARENIFDDGDIFADTYDKPTEPGPLEKSAKKKKSVSFENIFDDSDDDDGGEAQKDVGDVDEEFVPEDVFSDEEDAALYRSVTSNVTISQLAPPGAPTEHSPLPAGTMSTLAPPEYSFSLSPHPDGRSESPLDSSTRYYDGLSMSNRSVSPGILTMSSGMCSRTPQSIPTSTTHQGREDRDKNEDGTDGDDNNDNSDDDDVFASLPRRTPDMEDSGGRSSSLLSHQGHPRLRPISARPAHGQGQGRREGVLPAFNDVEEEAETETLNIAPASPVTCDPGDLTGSTYSFLSPGGNSGRHVGDDEVKGHQRSRLQDLEDSIIRREDIQVDSSSRIVDDRPVDVDAVSMETEPMVGTSGNIRRSSLLESLVKKQLKDPPSSSESKEQGDGVIKAIRTEELHSYEDRMRRDGDRDRYSDQSKDRDWDMDKNRDRERDRDGRGSPIRDRDLDGRGSPIRDRDRDGRGSPIRDRDLDGRRSPVRDRDGRGSPVRGFLDRHRSESPNRGYRDTLDGRSTSPTRSYRDSYPEDRAASPTRGSATRRELDFQPIRSGLNSSESTEWVSRNGSQSGRASATSEQELSRYFGDSHQSGRHSRSTPDPTAPEKPVSSSLLESGRRGVDRLSQILRRSNDRLADLDREASPIPSSETSRGRYSPANGQSGDGGRSQSTSDHSEYDREDRTRSLSRDRDRDRDWSRDHTRSREPSHDRSSGYSRDHEYSDGEPYSSSSQRDGSNQSSQPPLKAALVTSRTTPLSRSTARPNLSSTKASSSKDDAYRIQDLEDTVSSLKRVLKEREKEVDELKSQQRSLQAELHTIKNSEPNFDKAQYQRKVDSLIADRENLTTEVWRLKEELDNQRLDRSASPSSSLQSSSHPSTAEQLDHYDPNNPRALHRKINLESQVQDLQEANETASAKLASVEQQLEDAREENRLLRRNQADSAHDLREENALLKEQLESLRTEPSEPGRPVGASDGEYLTSEVRQLRTDLHHLRDRNHQLTQDNIKLTDYIRDLEARTLLNRTTSSGTIRSTRGPPSTGLTDYRRATPTRVDSDLCERVDRYQKDRQDIVEERIYPRSVSPIRHEIRARSHSPAARANRNSDDLRFSTDLRKDSYMRTHNGASEPSRNLAGHTSTNGYDYNERPGRAMSEKSDSTMYLTSMPATGIRENGSHPVTRDLDTYKDERSHVPLHGQAEPKSLKVDMIDDLIDESPATTRGTHQSPVTSTYTTKRHHTPGFSPSAETRKHQTSQSLDHDVSASSSKIQADMDDIDDDEFFLGPGNKTYKVSSAGGPKYTEPFITHINKTYDDLSTTSFSSSPKKHTESYKGLNDSVHKEQSVSSYSKSIQQSIDDLSDDDLDVKGSLQNGHSEARGSALSGHQGTERRDSISSDSTDYILIQAEQHLKHGSSVLDSPTTRIITDPQPNNKHLTGGSSLNSLPVARETSPHQSYSLSGTSSSSTLKPRSASTTPSSRTTLLSSGEALNTSGPTLPSSSLNTLTSQGRTHSPAFLSGQQNKGSYSPVPTSNRPDSATFGIGSKRPFAPRTPGEIRAEDVVKFTRQGGKISKGVVKYIGHLPNKNDTYLGIELEQEMGKHDGLYDGQRYFTCKPNRGVFVAFSRVVMAWSGPEY